MDTEWKVIAEKMEKYKDGKGLVEDVHRKKGNGRMAVQKRAEEKGEHRRQGQAALLQDFQRTVDERMISSEREVAKVLLDSLTKEENNIALKR